MTINEINHSNVTFLQGPSIELGHSKRHNCLAAQKSNKKTVLP